MKVLVRGESDFLIYPRKGVAAAAKVATKVTRAEVVIEVTEAAVKVTKVKVVMKVIEEDARTGIIDMEVRTEVKVTGVGAETEVTVKLVTGVAVTTEVIGVKVKVIQNGEVARTDLIKLKSRSSVRLSQNQGQQLSNRKGMDLHPSPPPH